MTGIEPRLQLERAVGSATPYPQDSIVVAAGALDITPDQPTRLAGYRNRQSLFEKIAQPLQASALILRDHRGRQQAIIGLDLLFIGPELTDRLRTFAKRTLNIDARDLLVVASHTHFAPPVDATKPALGAVDRKYLDWVGQQCCVLLRSIAEKPMQHVKFRLGSLQWDGVVYRRLRWWLPHVWGRRISVGGVVIAPNHRRQINRDLRLLELVNHSDEPLALIWSGSCHPLGWPNELELSSDYVGVVRERLRGSLGDQTPVLFLQGFAGDLRPDVPERRKLTRRLWRTILYGPSFDSFDETNWQTWVGNLVAHIATRLERIRRRQALPLTGLLASASVKLPLSLVLDGHNDDQRYVHFQRLHLGGMCDMLSVSAEPCSMLLSLLDDPTIWPIGYSGDVFGYWPTDRQCQEGGYEANDYLAHFNLHGKLRPDLDRLFRGALNRLFENLGRDLSDSYNDW